jgi:hypothetical protein
MSDKRFSAGIPYIITLGAVWGLAEAALGLGLEKCARFASGSIMTAAALFFVAAVWTATGRALGVGLAVVLVSGIKLFDALLLSLPLRHGAVANPIFAFWTEGLAFLFIFAVLKGSLIRKKPGRAVGGGLAALVGVSLFPLVKFATGIPACIYPGTQIPLSLYFAPLAVGLSFLTVPAGLWAGRRLVEIQESATFDRLKAVRRLTSPAALIVCLLIITIIRLAG